ncbi:hypothetical protein XM38_003060 [Halomicronema hongdechloris C2206]|uniref:Probable membrane transporter protein n=1 Tax=Halomicronema hongdechloris C2206 TaxID=1641165 RepID=A0A1Z3HGD8_9CYAN|nr:sulfite exporter TauE/SafE family protein [Halomicronema hongdechloris]ASC69379.1 hypothetical protein XM38_003060 [Halomicronema hongdechloris C2206]
MTDSLLTAAVLFGATLISSTFGFGSALFAMPLLTLVVGIETATPLFGLVGPTIAISIAIMSWQEIQLTVTSRLIAATLCGLPIGVWLIRTLPGDWLADGLGVALIGFGLYRLGRVTLPRLIHPGWAYPFGFVAGILAGAYNTNGPPVVVYGNLCRWPPERFRATLQGYFLPTGLAILASHGLGGLWSVHIFQLYGLSLPLVFLAVWMGHWLNRRLPTEQFERFLSGLLLVLGSLMIWR